jgi:hypothetical protein
MKNPVYHIILLTAFQVLVDRLRKRLLKTRHRNKAESYSDVSEQGCTLFLASIGALLSGAAQIQRRILEVSERLRWG